MKRSAADLGTNDMSPREFHLTRLRSAAIKGKIGAAIEDGNTEEFLESFNALKRTDYFVLFAQNQISDQIEHVIISGYAKLLERMLSFRLFRQEFTKSNIILAVTTSTADVLQVIMDAPWEDDEHDWFDARLVASRRILDHAITNGVAKTKLVLKRVSPTYGSLFRVSKNPIALKASIKRYLSERRRSLNSKRLEILSIVSSYFSYSYSCDFFHNWVLWREDDDGDYNNKPALFKQIDDLYDIILAGDGDALVTYLGRADLVKPEGQIMVAAHLAAAHGKIDILNDIRLREHHIMSTGRRLKWIILEALLNDNFDQTVSFLEKIVPGLSSTAIRFRMNSIFEMLLESSDIHDLYKLYIGWPQERFPLTQRQATFFRFAERTLHGDWRNLLIFMETNPHCTMLTQNAWSYLTDPNSSDAFIHLFR